MGDAGGLQAVLFDLDGTLVDSEGWTDQAISEELGARGQPAAELPPQATRGRTWADIAAALVLRYPAAGEAGELAACLERRWTGYAEHGDAVVPIPAAGDALAAASAALKLAVVSSSPRSVIDLFLNRLGVDHLIAPHARIGAGDAARPKPAPDGFLLAAARLGVRARACLVFEDSVAGLQAARAAGMAAVAVLHACAQPELCTALAGRSIRDYRELPRQVWARLASDGATVLGQPW